MCTSALFCFVSAKLSGWCRFIYSWWGLDSGVSSWMQKLHLIKISLEKLVGKAELHMDLSVKLPYPVGFPSALKPICLLSWGPDKCAMVYFKDCYRKNLVTWYSRLNPGSEQSLIPTEFLGIFSIWIGCQVHASPPPETPTQPPGNTHYGAWVRGSIRNT